MVIDAVGNTYTSGFFYGTIDFDREHTVAGDTLTSASPLLRTGFLAKYGPTGTLIWVKALTGSADVQATGIALDDRGDTDPSNDIVYVTGTYGPSVSFDGGTALAGGAQQGRSS